MLVTRCAGFAVPTMVVDRPGWLRVKRRTNSIVDMPASASRSSMPEVSQFRWPRPGSWVSGPVRQFLSSDAAPRAAPPRISVPAPLLVEALLVEHRLLEEEHFLEYSPAQLPELVLAGQSIGAYTLVSAIGHGGMGSVWLARRSDGRF